MNIRTSRTASTLVAALIVGCTWGTYDGSYTGGPGEGGTGTGPSGTIGPEGGKLSSSDGILTLDIPAAALGTPTQITIQLQSAQGSGSSEGPSYAVGPMSTEFQKPIGVLFHEIVASNGGQNQFAVTSNQQALLLGGTTMDDRGTLIFGITDHLGIFGVMVAPGTPSSAACPGSQPPVDSCAPCARDACTMSNGQSTSTGNTKSCICVAPSRANGLVQTFEGCAAMNDGATNCMASADIPPGGLQSAPGSVACGGTQCTLGSGDICCATTPNQPMCSRSSCTNQPLSCDEAADCGGPVSNFTCCGAQSGGASCVARGSCNGSQLQYCRTNSECASGSCMVRMAGNCIIETCGGNTPLNWPPPGGCP